MEPHPQSQPKLYGVDRTITGVSLQEAAIALLENDSAFGVLITECATMGSRISELLLDRVTMVRCRKPHWSSQAFPRVSIRPHPNGIWAAESVQSGLFFREPSELPYKVISISKEDYARLMEEVERNRPLAVFEFSQKIFGCLPGFDAYGDGLMVPHEYAAAGKHFPTAEYTTEK